MSYPSRSSIILPAAATFFWHNDADDKGDPGDKNATEQGSVMSWSWGGGTFDA
jgi:hypothetical protein